MIAFACPARPKKIAPSKSIGKATSVWLAAFLALPPDLRRQVRFAIPRLLGDRREEAVKEALADALVAYRRIAELGKTELAFASPLAPPASPVLLINDPVGSDRRLLVGISGPRGPSAVSRGCRIGNSDRLPLDASSCCAAPADTFRHCVNAGLSRRRHKSRPAFGNSTTDGRARGNKIGSSSAATLRPAQPSAYSPR